MKTIQFKIPDSIDLDDMEAKMLLASKLFERGKITSGQAAEIAGISKRTFLELLSFYGVSVINYPATEIENDFKNAKGNNS